MTNNLYVLIYAPLLVINLLLITSIIIKRNKRSANRYYAMLCMMLIGWQIMEILVYILPAPFWIAFAYTAKYVFIAFMPFLFFMMVMGFYRLDKRIKRWHVAALCVIPAITAFLSLSNPLFGGLFGDFKVLDAFPLTLVSKTGSPWYYVNLIYGQLMVLAIGPVVVIQRHQLPKAYQMAASLLLIGIGVYALGFFTEKLGLDGGSLLDFSLIAVCLANFLFYIAIASNERTDYRNTWWRNIFDYMDELIFILDAEGVVVDANRPAAAFMKTLGIQAESLTAEQLRKRFLDTGKVLIKPLGDEQEAQAGEDLYYTGDKYPVIYHISYGIITNWNKAGKGSFIAFEEVTLNRLMIERLQETAGIDPLTGLGNRYRHQQLLRSLDKPHLLPLSIIMGDVNGLKGVNDQYGHSAGDDLLTAIASILKQCCLKEGFVNRIGGDEFAMLLPGCDEREASAVIGRVQQAIDACAGHPYTISMALGSATKTQPEENINAMAWRADARMYTHKHEGHARDAQGGEGG